MGQRALPLSRWPALRRAGRRRPRPRPRRRHRPPRPQALERDGHRGRRGQDPRLRPRQAGRDAVPGRRHADGRAGGHAEPEPRGRDRRHARLHVAGAGGGKARRRPDDIFSFGVLLYQMLTGRHPFLARLVSLETLSAIREGEPGGADQGGARPAPEAERAILRCLHKEPSRRWRSMADLSAVLHDLREDSESGRGAEPCAPPATRSSRPVRSGSPPWPSSSPSWWRSSSSPARASPSRPARAHAADLRRRLRAVTPRSRPTASSSPTRRTAAARATTTSGCST